MDSPIQVELPRLFQESVEFIQRHLETERALVARLKRVQTMAELREVVAAYAEFTKSAEKLLATQIDLLKFMKEDSGVH